MTQETITTLDELWEAALPHLSPEDQRSAIVLLRELAHGKAVSPAQLALALGAPLAETQSLLSDSALTRFVLAGEDGLVTGFWFLATSPTHHRFTIDSRTLWTWCAQDSLFLPELLGKTAEIESKDPESGELVRLTVSPERVEAVQPSDVVVSMVRADAIEFSSAKRIIATACHYIFFFTSKASGERWVAAHPETVLLSLDEAFAFGRRQNKRIFGSALARGQASSA